MMEVQKQEQVLLIKFLGQPHGTPTISMILSLNIETQTLQNQLQVKSRTSSGGIIVRCGQLHFATFPLQRDEESE